MTEADFSYYHLFLQAHIVVKSVMVGLVLASVLCWGIFVEKILKFRSVKKELAEFESLFWSGQAIEKTFEKVNKDKPSGIVSIFVAAMKEWQRSSAPDENFSSDGIKERIHRVMDIAFQRETEKLRSRLIILATIGSAGPFVGLFGTVWGIMSSFRAMAGSKNTSLDVVAPGIAEALFATALGLVAAIPAVIIYNWLTNDAARISGRFGNFMDEFWSIVSRNIDKKAA